MVKICYALHCLEKKNEVAYKSHFIISFINRPNADAKCIQTF